MNFSKSIRKICRKIPKIRKTRKKDSSTFEQSWHKKIIDGFFSPDSRCYILDTETTGLVRGSRIVELCILSMDGRIVYNGMFNPTKPMPKDATRINGITDAEEKVIWRFDPLVLTATTGVDELLEKAAYIGHRLKEHTDKLVFSFADIGTYTRVKNNLAKDAIHYREFDRQTMEELAAGICRLNESWHLQLATCAEAIPLESYGILHNKCVDDDLLIKLFPHDKALMDSLGVQITIPDLFHQEPIVDKREKNRKDPGQREACRCVMSKDIGEYNTCPHLCKYCYANASAEAAWRNWQHHLEHPHAETIKGTY